MNTTDPSKPTRAWIARGFALVEDVLYIGLAVLLSGCAIYLIVDLSITFVNDMATGALPRSLVSLLDRILLVLLLAELLYTVQVLLRERTLAPEPFLLVGLIAVIRRVLVVTAEIGELDVKDWKAVGPFTIELAVLAGMIVALSMSLYVLRRRGEAVEARRM